MNCVFFHGGGKFKRFHKEEMSTAVAAVVLKAKNKATGSPCQEQILVHLGDNWLRLTDFIRSRSRSRSWTRFTWYFNLYNYNFAWIDRGCVFIDNLECCLAVQRMYRQKPFTTLPVRLKNSILQSE